LFVDAHNEMPVQSAIIFEFDYKKDHAAHRLSQYSLSFQDGAISLSYRFDQEMCTSLFQRYLLLHQLNAYTDESLPSLPYGFLNNHTLETVIVNDLQSSANNQFQKEDSRAFHAKHLFFYSLLKLFPSDTDQN